MDLEFLTDRSKATTPLELFIRRELDEYIEPERKGTPKGERVGFSKAKFKACLLSLTTLPQKTVAEISGVSYGLLRVWKTEEEFKQLQREKSSTFAHLFWELHMEKIHGLKRIKQTPVGSLTASDIDNVLNSIIVLSSAKMDMPSFGKLLSDTVTQHYQNEYHRKLKLPITQLRKNINSVVSEIFATHKTAFKKLIVDKIEDLFNDLSDANVTRLLHLLVSIE